MKRKSFLTVALIITIIVISIIVIPKLLATFKNEYFEILPNIIITKDELNSIKKAGEIEKVNTVPSENLLIYDGLEKNADYSNMSREEVLKGELATQKGQISIHYDDRIIFDILSAKFDSKEVLILLFLYHPLFLILTL